MPTTAPTSIQPDRHPDLRRSSRPHPPHHSAVKKRPVRLRPGAAWIVRPQQRRIRDLACGDLRIYLAVEVRRVACRRCGTAKQEQLAFLADNPFYAKALCLLRGPALS